MRAILIGLAMLIAGPGIDPRVTLEPDTVIWVPDHPDTIIWGWSSPETLIVAHADSICAVRGHVSTGICTETLMCSGSYIVDLPDRTLLITENPNSAYCTCARCGESFKVRGDRADTTIVWRQAAPTR